MIHHGRRMIPLQADCKDFNWPLHNIPVLITGPTDDFQGISDPGNFPTPPIPTHPPFPLELQIRFISP